MNRRRAHFVLSLVVALSLATGEACTDSGGSIGFPGDADTSDATEGAPADGSDAAPQDADGGEGPAKDEDVGDFPLQLQAGFEAVPLGPRGRLESVYAARADLLYAAGAGGAVLRGDGHVWRPEAAPTNEDLYAIWADDDLVVAVGANGALVERTTAGWTSVNTGTDATLRAVHGRGGTIYVVGDGGVVLRRTGSGWQQQDVPWASDGHAVWVHENGQVFVGGEQAQVLRLSGASWVSAQAAQSNSIITGFWGTPGSAQVLAVGTNGALTRWDGASWTVQVSNDTAATNLLSVWGVTEDDAWAVGDGGVLLRYAGKNWNLVPALGPENRFVDLRAVTVVPESNGVAIAVGEDGRGLVWAPEAASWTDYDLELQEDLHAVGAAGPIAVSVGDNGLALERTEFGWESVDLGTSAPLYGVFEAAGSLWVAGDGGALYRRTDGGYQAEITGLAPPLDARCGTASGDSVIVLGRGGTAWVKDERAWVAEPLPSFETVRAAVALADESIVAVGDSGLALVRSPAGAWTQIEVEATATLNAIAGTAAGAAALDGLWAVGDNGTVLRGQGEAFTLLASAPLDFYYGLWLDEADQGVVVGWSGALLQGNMNELARIETGTLFALESVVKFGSDEWLIAGQNGTLLRAFPETWGY